MDKPRIRIRSGGKFGVVERLEMDVGSSSSRLLVGGECLRHFWGEWIGQRRV